MKRIRYAGGDFLTSDAMAATLLDLATALARRNTADTLVVPIVTATGESSTAKLVLGPASQVLAEQAGTEFAEPDFAQEIAEFEKRRQALGGIPRTGPVPIATDEGEGTPQGELWFDEPTEAPYGN
jgi:hypothetical protein